MRRHVGCFPAKDSALGRETDRHRDAAEDGRRARFACRVRRDFVLAAADDCVGAFARENRQAAIRKEQVPVIACYEFSKALV
jgi:hypothetical protein